ncbi:MAG: NAD(P)/FAD-dependent oxidoreductase [Novosphingobium sp.]|nr:NAD(P)/FAD-dependent oxidoreductase [Novosphingobium sp.]MCP5401631.1 NAD(P)/FAD-dependent oxidoreductase [Novosphingobium sp.]
MQCAPTQTPDVELASLREKYRLEAEKRHRPEGFAQYLEARGEYEEYFEFDPYSPPPPREPVSDEIDVVMLGGGFAGLNVAGRLKEAGIDNIRIIDRGGDFGGTWYWNRYPGVQCDVESYSYLPLLEEVGYMPRERYSYGPEIFEYCQLMGRHFDLYEHALFGTVVTSLRWDESIRRWRVGTRQGDDIRARFVVMAPGPLNRPKLPGVPGIKSFRGHSFHTMRWDYDYTGGDWRNPVLDRLGDKKVAIIGTGATAIQCVPSLGEYANHLYVFQRTPSYIDDRGNQPTDPEWARSLQPGWQAERMHNFHVGINEVFDRDDVDLICDGWSEVNRNIQAKREAAGWPEMSLEELMELREVEDYRAMERIRQRVDSVIDDPKTADILKPWYRFLCKRPCFNDDYLPTFNRPNVTLVDVSDTRGIERITETGIVANGEEYEVDCIIYASGFESTTDLRRRYGIDAIEGRDGLSIYDHWANGFRTLHGMTVHNFPNLLFTGWLQGGVSGSTTLMYDQQGRHISYIVGETMKRGAQTFEPSARAEADWVRTIKENLALDKAFWESCTPGYNNNEGLEVTRYTIFGEPYGPGYDAFDELIGEWRDEGGMQGMVLQP